MGNAKQCNAKWEWAWNILSFGAGVWECIIWVVLE